MYETHFGLRQRPFPAMADNDFYYPATCHELALAQLQQTIQDDEGFALLLGEPGTGKTILCHCLLDRLGETVTNAFLTHSHFPDRTGLLQALLYDLSVPHEGRSEQELRLALTDLLLKNHEAGRRTLLVLDEAQHLTPDLLEELRLLGNLEGRGGRAFQVVLAAQPAILETLRLPSLVALKQRLAVYARLEPLGLHEAADYVLHHLRAAGGRPDRIVSDEALEILAQGTRGIPRLLNRAMNQALTVAFTAGATLVDAEAAVDALDALGLTAAQETAAGRPRNAAPEPAEAEDVSSEREIALQSLLPLEDGAEGSLSPTELPFPSPRRPA
jgi:general secretion pathway protein A